MFLTHRKGVLLNGENPLLMCGYGGFNKSQTPYFSLTFLIWLENNGMLAVPNLRGGGEYGDKWHSSGILDKKQNTFDDFIAAAEWLIEKRYTVSTKLVIWGGSNGGLTVAASMVQRPDLFGAVACFVPPIDMLRYPKGRLLCFAESDWGNAEKDPRHFKFIYAYSPLHNIKAGVSYPATIVHTAENDQRCESWHAFKFIAALQDADVGENPILLRYARGVGHGEASTLEKYIEETSDIYGFLYKSIDIRTKY
jgi:prolyl oligopeptidase